MDNINEIMRNYDADRARITSNEEEREYCVLGYQDVPVSVPYSELADATRQRNTLERLLRKNVPEGTILAFIERAKTDNRWG
ncbi:hypothetical protein ABRY95_13880 [Castellaniella ginsengisoli]|uniref:Uncharacterized protein n=1 Tax=Castellaniella ginsengisoli TaxID=546114 RepID=A0AB39GY14_9BURK